MPDSHLSDFVSALPLPSVVIQDSERIAAVNAEALTLIGQGVEGRNFVTILRQPQLVDTVEAVWKDGKSRNTKYYSSDGPQETIFNVSVRLLDDRGTVLLCFMDVTHLEQAGQMRRDFVANVSHELRTPLTALMGFIETLRGPARDDATARDRFLDIMEGEAGRMNRLVGDLLSLSRVEGDERVRPRDQVDLIEIIHSVLQTLRQLANEARIEFETDFGMEKLPLLGDADQLMQVFTNLVENAIKYGGAGERVTIRIDIMERDPTLRAPGVRVHVIDYGAGIDPIHLPRLTERFYRADNHRSRALGGTGLGLAIVKHIINRHRGRLRVESELGSGAKFTVILPTQADSFT